MISPLMSSSEAFLIGLVVGERERFTHGTALDHLAERLKPFVPSLLQVKQVYLDKLPSDAKPYEGYSFHFSPAFQAICSTGDKWLAIAVDSSRQSLVDLVAGLVQQDPASGSKLEATFEKVCRRLVNENEIEEPFLLGRAFGRLVGEYSCVFLDLQQLEYEPGHTMSLDLPTATDFERRRRDLLRALLESRLVASCFPLQQIIQTELNRLQNTIGVYLDSNIDDPASLSDPEMFVELNIGTQSLWLAIGTAFRFLQEFTTTETRGMLPRQFLTARLTTMPAIRGSLEIAQQELHSSTPRLTPDAIVFHLVTGIEPLVKSLKGDSKKDVTDILSEMMRFSSGHDEAKFASVANSLYRTYRNEAVHAGHTLHQHVSTWSEALFVYSAMRLLVDLHEVISSRLTKGSVQS